MEKVVFDKERFGTDYLYAQSNIVFEKLCIYGDGTMMEMSSVKSKSYGDGYSLYVHTGSCYP